jgi:hypothetical protein
MMSVDDHNDRFDFVEGRALPAFAYRVITIAPGEHRGYDEGDWHDALVVVKGGHIELEGLSGRRYRFEPGDILFLADLPLLAVHNVGPQPAVLIAISRQPFACAG